MLQELKEQLGLTYILVSHDLSVVGYLATKIAVMYCGRVFEYGPATEVFGRPRHPYSQALLRSVPEPDDESVDDLASLPGTVASVIDPPSGCRFHPRCEKAMPICGQQEPPRVECGDGHHAYCWLLK